RTGFTVLSIAMSLFLVTLLYGFLASQDRLAAQSAGYKRLVVTHRQGLTSLLPVAHLDKLRTIEGVKAATQMSWFGGKYKDDRLAFTQFAVDANAMMNVHDELKLPPDQLSNWQRDAGGCVVGKRIAHHRGWKLGDKIVLKGTFYDVDLELTVDGIYDGSETADLDMLWFHWTYLDESLKAKDSPTAGQIGIVVLKTDSAEALPEVARRIESRFTSSDAPVRAMTEQAFQQMFGEMVGNVQAFIRNTAMAVVFSLVCVAANAMAMSLRERTREIAVLKAIGFQRGTILRLVLGEALAIALLGGFLGALGAKLGVLALVRFADLSRFPLPGINVFHIPWITALYALGLSAAIGLASGLVPAWRAASVSVVAGLRRVV
ncbi:MAG TPA: ABC transporter permease, partial [Pirellulales bacterium]|nr:ABC transporter permease [Pirellulales bacterium]